MKSKAQKGWKSLKGQGLWVHSLQLSLILHNLAIKRFQSKTKILRLNVEIHVINAN
jgi:hypothetical protein